MRLPKRTDKKIAFDQYEQVVKDVSKLNNIQFDPTVFSVINDGTGYYVTIDIQPEVTEFAPRGEETLYKVCALRSWGVPETGSPTLSTTQLIPVSGDPYGYAETTLEPTWDYVRFTTPSLSGE